jgi:uncharacterized protein involved in exopolysaccharide biosynthesis
MAEKEANIPVLKAPGSAPHRASTFPVFDFSAIRFPIFGEIYPLPMDVFDDERTDGAEFFSFLYRKWKLIAGFLVISLVVCVAVTLYMPKRYVSQCVVFPAYNNNLESVIDNPIFGYDVEADRMLQLLASDEVRDSVMEKFNLLSYYEIDENAPDWRDQLREKFTEDIKFERTPYMSIIISAETEKPELSASIANYIIDLTDEIRNRIFKKNQLSAFHSIEKEYVEKKRVVDTLKADMERLRRESQVDLVAILNPQGLVQTSGSGAKTNASTEFERTLNQYIFEQSRLNEIAARYERARANSERPITQSYIVDRAKPSYKKVSPSLRMNLAVTAVASLAFSIVVLLLAEKFGKIRAELNNAKK